MASKLDELRRRAEAAARELNEKYDLKSKVDQGGRMAADALRKGATAAASALDLAREEASRIDRENRISETVVEGAKKAARAAGDTARAAEETVNKHANREKVDEVINDARAKTSDLFEEARRYYDNAAGAAKAGTSAARLPSSVLAAISSLRKWAKENPSKAAIVSLAFVAGTRAGSAFSNLDAVVLGSGAGGNWFFHSAIVPYGLRKLSEKYEHYLKQQEQLLRDGKLDEAQQSRVKFERDLAKYVGAPLLGAFSIAMGGSLLYEAVTGGVVGGLPINLVVGGNPLLSGVWLFGNGLLCFHNGYKFFMMALADQDEVTRVVADIKGLLPSA
ncbi:MAG TPA: hypothetical protein VI756_05695 [Blastocatellia bacterium]